MNILLSTPAKGKSRVEERKFGSLVDYFLFGLRSPRDFAYVATALGDHCHCTMTMLKSFSVPSDTLQAKFPMAFAQFNPRGISNSLAELSVDKLNLVLFKNKTADFDKMQSPLAQKGGNGIFDFVDDSLSCYALNNRGIFLRRSKLRDVDYFVMVYAKKDKDAGSFAKFVQTFPLPLTDFSEYIKENSSLSVPAASSGSSKKSSADVKFLQGIFDYAEKQIDNTMKNIRENKRFVRA